MEFINLPQIIRSKHSKKNMPSVLTDEDIAMVVYSLSQPIRSRILNHKKFVTELDLDQFIENKDTVKCHCYEYNTLLLKNERGHLLTGSLKIIKNNKPRKLFSKGPKYCEPEQIDFGSAICCISRS